MEAVSAVESSSWSRVSHHSHRSLELVGERLDACFLKVTRAKRVLPLLENICRGTP